ncbi:DUF2515 family protein [Herbaspirillum rubrisubalbicans]|uniref:Uncharacterized protein n=1 Tax=Herbaspirillum rubrisubalbicans TaxID=80842 RepID=A0AAD0UB17_9BURK|nr:hypothetical protein [Herbaspirillum rubrisubalbicans]AYR25137.1 hypothetical protein RC54_15495 [Herbaspirillum rubrisubalbicans]
MTKASDSVKAGTNTTKDSCVEVQCNCDTMWSLVQQQCTKRLCKLHGRNEGRLLAKFNVRARRIAATYARFYLEMEQGQKEEFKGRFYWMALGAFASKTVACSLELLRVQLLPPVVDGLGKGNFWLFQDIAGWHWYYTQFNPSVSPCFEKRDSSAYVSAVKAQMEHFPWHKEALNKINNMRISPHIRKAFESVRQFESTENAKKKLTIQMDNLLAIADHEQRIILQPLIYADPCFSGWVKTQRSVWVSWASPELSLAFTCACDTKEAHHKSIAPKETELEDEGSRMAWITKAAKTFHLLMQREADFMEEQLQAIATWSTMEDPEPPIFTPPKLQR